MKRKFSILTLIFCLCFNAFAQTQNNIFRQTQTDVVILSKPRAIYTEKARKKGFEGIVQLRITFMANGEIGEIVNLTTKKKEKLEKYGLMQQAIEAAKKIKFTPATKDGQPISVTKQIQYSFSIY